MLFRSAEVGVAPITRKVPFALAYGAGALLEVIARLTGQKNEPRMTRFLAYQLAKSHWFAHKRAEAVLGYREQVSTEEGMARLLAWLRTEEMRPVAG